MFFTKTNNLLNLLSHRHTLFKINHFSFASDLIRRVGSVKINDNHRASFAENEYLLSVIKPLTKPQLETTNLIDSVSSLKQFLNLSTQDDKLYLAKFSNIANALIDDINCLSNNEFKIILTKLSQDLFDDRIQNLEMSTAIYTQIDRLLSHRLELVSNDNFFQASTVDEIFEISHLFYLLKHSRLSEYIKVIIKKIETINLQPTKSEFIKIMYIINLSRSPMSLTLKTWSQDNFLTFISVMTIEEIAVACSAFFKTQSYFENAQLIEKIMQRTIEDIELIQSAISLSSILKAIGYTRWSPDLTLTKLLIDKCLNNFKHLNIINITHLTTLTINHKYYYPEFIDFALTILENFVCELRVKEVERIIKSCVHFDHLRPPYQKIINIIEKQQPMLEKYAEYEQAFCSLLVNIVVFEIYPSHMLQNFFSHNFLERLIVQSKGSFHLHLLTLRDAIKIECYPKYEKELKDLDVLNLHQFTLPSHFNYASMKKILSEPNCNLTPNEKLLKKCYLSIKETYKEQADCKNILSFLYYPEIVITSEKDGLMKQFKNFNMVPGSIKNCTIVVIQFKFQFNDEACEHFIGFQRLRVRLLSKLGFHVVLVPYYEVFDLNRRQLIRYFQLKLNVPVIG